ncbi:ABC transporter ATP-binding protein [Mesorhizobium sp. J428]|uniref:ABC transporter ATP-binding protein n=1 Tax=Mesorhizobium sp. J428 TaxID=2898440 RepID=UPI002150A137|nr:ABC transporter ATP-binding protein [Mesorhizobium sp. J428]MCR5857977.1 ABC transporter ATP-binding protein [Mesorhizobium sp. J428]
MKIPFSKLRDLGKRFASQSGQESPWIIKDLSFHVREGEFLTIVGPSGSGKSTMLNALAQIDKPTTGAILMRQQVISDGNGRMLNPGWNCEIGYVTQEDNLMPWRTLVDNVLFPLQVQNRLTSATRQRAADLMKSVGLAGFENYYPHQLSGGMRKRAALIRTLAYDPPVILMDEPFGAVDAQTRISLQTDLLNLWQAGRKTIIFVTHDIGEAIALGDRTLVLTNSPARIAGEFDIDIPRPRSIHDVFSMPGFPKLYNSIRSKVN